MKTSRTQNSVKNATINLLAKLVTMLCGFVIRSIFLKYLGDQYTGVSTLFTDILNILSFTELGIGTAVSFSLYKPIAEDNDFRIAQLMKLYKYIYFLISCMVLLLGLLFVPFLKLFVTDVPDIQENITLIYVMYVIKTAFSYLLVYKSTFVIAKQKQYVVTGIEGACITVKTVVDVVLLMTTRNFMAYLWLEIICVIATNLIIYIYAKKELKEVDKEIKIEKSDFLSLFKDVKDVFIYKINGIVLNSTDSMIISHFVNITSVTLLSNYNIIVNSINGIIYQMISAMTASVGNLAVSTSKNEQKRVFMTMNFLSFIFSMVECTGIWLCANSFVTILWGEKYVLHTSIIAALCINSFIINMHLSVDMFRTANGLFHKGRMRPLVTAIINLTISLIAVHYIGLFGVLLGTVVSRATTQMWYDPKLVFTNVFNCSVKKYFLRYLAYFVITLSSCLIGSLLLNALPQNAVLKFVIGFIYAVLFNLTVIIICFRKTDEFKNALSYIKTVIFKK